MRRRGASETALRASVKLCNLLGREFVCKVLPGRGGVVGCGQLVRVSFQLSTLQAPAGSGTWGGRPPAQFRILREVCVQVVASEGRTAVGHAVATLGHSYR